ncbi:hypothetical protein VAE308_1280157 [Vibrio aestuarianus]|nr:hypothetical protein VAE308_1280157 [Vibrio aestuarianus]
MPAPWRPPWSEFLYQRLADVVTLLDSTFDSTSIELFLHSFSK